MSTDRELLEAAAKAAGIDLRRLPDAWPNRFDYDQQWNPLADYGDAIELAAALKMRVSFGPTHTRVKVRDVADGVVDACPRRAITRAAAMIGGLG